VERLAQGDLLLWVNTPDEESERQAEKILKEEGAQEVRLHNLPPLGPDAPEGEAEPFDLVDEALRQTFPASDPPSFIAGREPEEGEVGEGRPSSALHGNLTHSQQS